MLIPAAAFAQRDTAAARGGAHTPADTAAADSVLVESPLPGGAADVARFLLTEVPRWLQITGLVIGAVLFAVAAWWLFTRRRDIRRWIATRTHAWKLALAAAAVIAIVAVLGAGAWTWNFTQHENAFCTSCHVMNPAFQRFADESNEHGKLSCHDCHQQSTMASVRQLLVWVAERPDRIGEHAKVPTKICESCHVTGDTAKWQHVAATAGHRVHLESDSSALDDLECVTCHGEEVHRFRPVSRTCGQSGCHKSEDTDIVLGKMAEQTVRHCTSCHGFTADVPALATRDSARGTLVPGKPECLGCHEMRKVLADFDEAKDPHGGKCGTCHNPHVQQTASAAAKTCASAGCHSSWRDEPFHTGQAHRRVAPRCLTCHLPHRAEVDASECESCHRAVRTRGTLRPPLPFDTSAALRRTGRRMAPREPAAPHAALPARAPAAPRHSLGTQRLRAGPRFSEFPEVTLRYVGWEAREPPAPGHRGTGPPAAAVDSFSHARHAKLACLECHETGTGHGRLTFERPRGCDICHHQQRTPARCGSCHRPEEYEAAKKVTVTVTVPRRRPQPRAVEFLHEPHRMRTCVECHTTPVTLAPEPSKAQCRDCHADHHDAGRTCSTCHRIADPGAEHWPVEVAHQRCDACHTATTVARLTPTRSFCATCHAPKATNHHDRRECTVCHFLTEPPSYRTELVTRPPE